MKTVTHLLSVAVLLAALQGASVTALAQAARSFTECATIESNTDRLACYDRAAGRVDAPPPASGPPLVNAGASAPSTNAVGVKGSLIDAAWAFAPGSSRNVVALHEPNYLLLARYSDNVNTAPFSPLVRAAGLQEPLDDTEAKFQLSLKGRLWATEDLRWGVWLAYSQQSHWRVYDAGGSRPFRETNYRPELFVSYRPGLDFGDFHWRLLNFGISHESNGRAGILSRSWNRLFAQFGVERGNLVLLANAWYRIKESAGEDDNPDLTDYYGYGSLSATYKWGEQSFSLTGRGNLSTGKGAVQATWMSKELVGPLRVYVQLFSGYGESLIDYNWNQTTIGAGFAVNDAF